MLILSFTQMGVVFGMLIKNGKLLCLFFFNCLKIIFFSSWDNTQKYTISIDDLTVWSKKGLIIFGGCCNVDPTEIARFRNLINALL